MRWTRRTLGLGVLLLLCHPLWAADANEFAPKNGMFTIVIPAGEHAARRTVLTIGAHKVPVEAEESKADDGSTFRGASIGIPATVMRDVPAEERFAILGDAIAKAMAGKMGDQKDIAQNTVPGKEFQVQTKDGMARVQLYTVAGFVIYAVVEGKKQEDIAGKDADTFFASLKLTDKAKAVFAKVKR
jgi:hypothetical protein